MTRHELRESERRYKASVAECALLRKKLTLVKKKTSIARERMDMNAAKEAAAQRTAQILQARYLLLKRQKETLSAERDKVDHENTLLRRRGLDAEARVQSLATTVEENENIASLSKLENEVLAKEVRNERGENVSTNFEVWILRAFYLPPSRLGH